MRKDLTVNISQFSFEKVVADFKNGDEVSVQLCDKLTSLMTDYSCSYLHKVDEIKKHLIPKRYEICTDYISVRAPLLSSDDVVYMVRLFNLGHKQSKIIVINNEIVYIPHRFSDYPRDHLVAQIESNLNRTYRERRKLIVKKRTKQKLSRLFRFGRPAVKRQPELAPVVYIPTEVNAKYNKKLYIHPYSGKNVISNEVSSDRRVS